MEKRKVFKISIIDKEISRTEFDRNTFYTSDSELKLVFKLIEKDYTYEHGEILLYNEVDESFVTRPIAKKENDFVYELDLDIIPHYGTWKAQLQLVNEDDVYTSKPFEFKIVNDLSNLAPPPKLTDINDWLTLKQIADELIDEMQEVIANIERAEIERVKKENTRQQLESEREKNELLRKSNEAVRQENEYKRKQSEKERENNEKQRISDEFERDTQESIRQKAESQRQSTFETNEQERQSAEIIRVDNENRRNLTSVDEFIKLQNAIGGRNIILGSDKVTTNSSYTLKAYQLNVNSIEANVEYTIKIIGELSEGQTGWYFSIRQNVDGVDKFPSLVFITESDRLDQKTWVKTFKMPLYNNLTGLIMVYSTPVGNLKSATIEKIKLAKGSQSTPYTKAPEDYTVVSKEDYYNHIKLMNEFKDSQFKQLKQAVLALGGTI